MIPNIDLSSISGNSPTRLAHKKVKIICGNPNKRKIRLSSFSRKNPILLKLPNIWNMLVSARACSKGKILTATGKRILLIPKAAMFPKKAAKKPVIQKNIPIGINRGCFN